MRRWHVVNNLAKTLSPAAEAFRYFMLERGEAFLAQQFARHDVAHTGGPIAAVEQ